MALRNLIDSQCGAQNPLVGLAQQLQQDRAFQDEGLRSGRPMVPGGAQDRQAPGSFHMGELLHQMNALPTHQAASSSSQWAQQFQGGTSSAWTTDFMASPHLPPQQIPSTASNMSMIGTQMHPSTRMNYPMMGPLPVMPMLPLMPSLQHTSTSSKLAADILTESEQRTDENSELRRVAREFVQTTDDGQVKSTDFFKFAQELGATVQGASNYPAAATTSEQWASELANEQSDATKDRDDSKFWQDLEQSWNNASVHSMGEQWAREMEVLPEAYKTYKFNDENPLENISQNPFQEGLEKLREGDLPSAVLLFEAAVKKDSTHMEAWLYLGTSQAQNEQDVYAIAALRQCLALDPTNVTALSALSVSYTNEGMQLQACETLEEWLRANPKYAQIAQNVASIPREKKVTSLLRNDLHNQVRDMYISAAQLNPENPDPDVQSGLGVLLNLTGEYDKAADCFRSALAVHPEDSLLWNRLGATLANGGRSEEAIEAYRNALQLSPGFIRSRFNLGISCINLSSYQQAAEHLLTALNMQDNATTSPSSNTIPKNTAVSNNIWSTLRMVVTLLNRADLYVSIDKRDLPTLNAQLLPQ